MRFEFKLRIGPIAIEASDYEYFVPFQLTLWRYDGSHGHSVCNLRWGRFNWHGWKDKAQVRFICESRIVNAKLVVESEDEWDDIVI